MEGSTEGFSDGNNVAVGNLVFTMVGGMVGLFERRDGKCVGALEGMRVLLTFEGDIENEGAEEDSEGFELRLDGK